MSRVTKYTLLFAAAFLAMHGLSLLSFFVEPLRPVLFFILLGAAAVFALTKPDYVALPIIFELLLDSSGHLFEWRGLSLRLLVLVVTIAAWIFHTVRRKELWQKLNTPFTAIYGVIIVIVALAAYNGFLNGHDMRRIIADAIPFAYLALFYPVRDLLIVILEARRSRADRIQSVVDPIVRADDYRPSLQDDSVIGLFLGSFLGAAALSLITLFLFSSGLQEIHGPFYTWWRDWVAGKATSTGFGFYRIVTPLHLFLTALVPYVAYRAVSSWSPSASEGDRIHKLLDSIARYTRSRMTFLLLLVVLLVPTLNFSRIYFLAIIPATLVMALKLPWKKVLLTLILIGIISLAEFTLINLVASRGQSFGFEFITKQSRGIIDPESEASASARAAILPHLIKKIKNRPLLGEGLGASVTYFNPFLQKELTTPHLDWGYLELAVEFGLFAVLLFVGLLVWLFYRNLRNPLAASILIFLAVTTLTTPALFHVYGILLILAVLLRNHPQPLDKLAHL